MKLSVEIPTNYTEERDYIISVMLGDFLGLDFDVQRANRDDIRITAGDGRDLVIADCLFESPDDAWLTDQTLPRHPLKLWDTADSLAGLELSSSAVPVIYGKALPNGGFCRVDDDSIQLGLDVFGSAFFMLTRYEELVKADRDNHDRFPATASLAFQEDFLDRPIVNEYLEILWACLTRLWPAMQRKTHDYRVVLSHDVDHPLSIANKSWPAVFRNMGGDVLHRKDALLAARRFYARMASNGGSFDADPCNTFDYIMDLSERHGLRSAFYFITDHSAAEIDGDYSIDMPWVRDLMRRIYARGYEIGLHPSYNTFRDAAQTKHEFAKLLEVAEKEGIKQDQWGGRQHFLRWEAPTTWQIWDDVGLSYDSTLSYADQVGFRCGTCYEFPTFNVRERKRLRLYERPLMVMECSLLAKEYMNFEPQASRSKMLSLAETCRHFKGQFTLLWHNNALLAGWQKRLYQDTVEAVM